MYAYTLLRFIIENASPTKLLAFLHETPFIWLFCILNNRLAEFNIPFTP